MPLETQAQAERFNRRLVNACLRAQTQEGPVLPGQLHVAIVGAGATGTEFAAELHRTIREVVAYGLDRIDPQRDVRIVLIEAAPRILSGLPERISEATQRLLEAMGVEVRTGARVTEVTAQGITLADGSFIASELVVWAAGVKAPRFLAQLDGLEINRINQLVVEQTLQTTRDPAVFAIGDCAACPRPGSPTPVPPRAQAAHQEASHMVRQIECRLRGQKLLPYKYRDFGSLVSLGKWSTVGNLMGFLFGRSFFVEGLFAQIIYRSLRLMHDQALGGTTRAVLGVVVRTLARHTGPQVKLQRKLDVTASNSNRPGRSSSPPNPRQVTQMKAVTLVRLAGVIGSRSVDRRSSGIASRSARVLDRDGWSPASRRRGRRPASIAVEYQARGRPSGDRGSKSIPRRGPPRERPARKSRPSRPSSIQAFRA